MFPEDDKNTLAHIGQFDESINYTDRPTVKVIVRKGDKILLLNNGLLPGGGVDEGESKDDAITRELMEELGMTVSNLEEVGTVIQYRNLLNMRYIIHGYTGEIDSTGGITNPQDTGEAQFTITWRDMEDALRFVSESIADARLKPVDDDINQGRLYNLMTTYELLKASREQTVQSSLACS